VIAIIPVLLRETACLPPFREPLIPMMMMIVDLCSTLHTAPLLHYVSRCIVKRNVFSADRKDPMLSDGSRGWSGGSRFQTIGPATENARRPNLYCDDDVVRSADKQIDTFIYIAPISRKSH